MRFYGIWKCKQCGAILNIEDRFDGIFKDSIKPLFSKDEIVAFVQPYKSPDEATIHRCNKSAYGLCELIGWMRNEE